MSEGNEDDPLSGILGDELGEWDKMFDSLHEEAKPQAKTEEQEADARALRETDPLAEPPEALDFSLEELPDMEAEVPPAEFSPESPFDDEGDFLLGPPGAAPSGPVPSADDDVNFGGVPEALGTLLGSGEHEDAELEISETPRSASPGVGDVAFDDALLNSPVSAEDELARISESANAFFEEGPTREVSLELDEDFYDGIVVSGNAIPTPIPEDEPIQSAAFEVPEVFRHDDVDDSEFSAVTAVQVAPELGDLDDDEEDDGVVVEAFAPEESDGISESIESQGHGALRTTNARADSEDSLELASEVEGALEDIRTDPPTPVPGESPSSDEAEEPPTPEIDDGVIHDRAPRLDGVVEAAVEDAVAMSTGTLHTGPQLLEADVEPDLPAAKFSLALPELDLARIHVAERVEADTSNRTEETAKLLVLYERELQLLDEPGAIIRIRIESGRLAESLGDLDRARRHLDEALKLDPRLVPANRALRRIERRLGNWDQVLGQLDNEIVKAGAMEARALSAYRVDLLMAVGEPDLARVAVGELLDSAPKDTRALLANLELAFVDGRDDEVQSALGALSESLSGAKLRSAMCALAGALAAQDGNNEKAATLFAEAETASPNLGAQLAHAAVLHETAAADEYAALASSIGEKSSELGAALAWQRAEAHIATQDNEKAMAVLRAALESMPSDALLLECALRSQPDSMLATQAWLELAEQASTPEEGAAAVCQAMRFAMADGGESEFGIALAEQALSINPKDECAYVEFRRLGGNSTTLDSVVFEANTTTSVFRRCEMFQQGGDLASASAAVAELLAQGDASVPSLVPYQLELEHALGQPAELAIRYSHMAEAAGTGEVEALAQRSAARALTVVAAKNPSDGHAQIEAAELWRAIAVSEPGMGAEIARLLASRGPDSLLASECEAIAVEQATHELRRFQLAIVAAGRNLLSDPGESADALSALQQESRSQRNTELYWTVSLATERYGEAAEALEGEIARASEPTSPHSDRYRYRAAYVRVQHDIDLDAAVSLLTALEANRPEFGAASDLMRIARGHGGVARGTMVPETGVNEQSGVVTAGVPQDSIGAEIRQIELLARSGSHGEAAERAGRLHTRHPDDALVQHAFQRYCWLAGASAELAGPALAELRLAEERSDGPGKARACEALARIDLELRGDRDSARMFWESASKAAPERADLQRILESEYRASQSHYETYRSILGRVIATLESGDERSAYLLARARISSALERDPSAIRSDYEAALEDNALCREALFVLESEASAAGPTETLANLEAQVSQYFTEDPRARGAFLVRSGETWRSLGQRDQCLARLKAALQVMPGFAPALSAWRDLALDHELWAELAEACLIEASSVDSDAARASLCLLAGVTLMDRVDDTERAISSLRHVLAVEPLDREAFVRLRILFEREERAEDLAQLYSMRLDAGPEEVDERCELHLALARVLSASLEKPAEALPHYREFLALRPNDREAVTAVAQIAWDTEKWADAAEALMLLARIEGETEKLAEVFTRLGTIYAEHLPEPTWALKSFHKVVTLVPGDRVALHRIAELGAQCGEHRLALGACEQLIKQEPPVPERIGVLIRMGAILRENMGDATNAERALRHALDLDPGSDKALDALVQFYVEQKDLRSARLHVDRVANAMRKRIDESAVDAEAYRVLARAMAAKANAGAAECMPTAQVAASLALKLGIKDAETSSIAKQVSPGLGTGLAGDTFDDLLFSHSASGEARTLFALLGGRLAKHIGIDVRSHGVGRSDRLRKGVDQAAGLILELAAEMGVEDVDIYVSKKKPRLVAVEPTNPFSLILGEEVASAERLGELRFVVGRSLKGAAASLSAPLQLGVDRFGVLLVGLLRQFNADFSPSGVDEEAAGAEQQRLRRLIPSNLLEELKPYALGLATSDFDHTRIWHAMSDACNRAGLICAGDGSAAIAGLMRSRGIDDLRKALQDPEIVSLVRYACSGEHARLWAAMRA